MTDFFYVDTAAVDSSGDGTTRNHSGGTTYAFDSIATALSGLSLADDTIIRCAGSTNDTGQCDFDAVTYNGFSLTVIADDGTDDSAGGGDDGTAFDNDGVHDGDTAFDTTNKYAIVRSDLCILVARTDDVYTLEKIQAQSTGTGNYDFTVGPDRSKGTFTVKRCRLQSAGKAVIGYNGGQQNGSCTFNIQSNILQLTSNGQKVFEFDDFGNYANSMVFNIRSNTLYGDSTSGLIEFSDPPNSAPTVNFYNNAVYNAGNGGTWVNHSPTGFTFNRSHNAYSDSNSETSEQSSITNTAEWTSPGLTDAADFSVKDSNAQIHEGGTSAEVIDPDIVGTTRKATPDIGAWELAGGGGTTVTVGQASETDTAFGLTASKAATVGQAAESDTAQPVTGAKAAGVGLATETDSAFGVTASRASTVGQPQEANSAQPVSASRAASVGLATENDTAFGVASSGETVVPVGIAGETDSAFGVTASRSASVAQAQETDSAFGVTASKAATVGQAVESETAFAVTAARTATVGQAAEDNTAHTVTARKALAVGRPIEVDTAFALTAARSSMVGLALETDTALSFPTVIISARPGDGPNITQLLTGSPNKTELIGGPNTTELQ